MIGINIKKLLHIVNTKVIMDQILMINVVFKNLEVLLDKIGLCVW